MTSERSIAPVEPSVSNAASIMYDVIVKGDLSKLSPEQRAAYYVSTCESIGLNPLTKPFDYITLNGKMVLYPQKGATDQLRNLYKLSIGKPEIQFDEGLVVVTVTGRDPSGREDTDVGAVALGNLQGDARANAIMKAITKAKRRLTLSMVGLGMLDETEVETIPNAKRSNVDVTTGEIIDARPVAINRAPAQLNAPTPPRDDSNEKISTEALANIKDLATDRGIDPGDFDWLVWYQTELEDPSLMTVGQGRKLYKTLKPMNTEQIGALIDAVRQSAHQFLDRQAAEAENQ